MLLWHNFSPKGKCNGKSIGSVLEKLAILIHGKTKCNKILTDFHNIQIWKHSLYSMYLSKRNLLKSTKYLF